MKSHELLQTMDARDWAKEFIRLNPECGMDEDMMIAWFSKPELSNRRVPRSMAYSLNRPKASDYQEA